MGCGNSKLNPEGELIPPRIRPLLLRSKLSELRKRKNGTNLRDGTMSKKVLLTDGESEEDSSMLVDNRKSMGCSHEGSTNCLDKDKDKDEHDSASAIPLSNHATKDGEQSNHLLEEEEPLSNVQLETIHPDETPDLELKQDKTMDEHKCIQQGDENKEEEEKEGSPDNDESRGLICPGSPSFRVYFVEETQDDKENVEMKDAGMEEDVSHKKSPSHDSVESTTSAKFAEGHEKKVVKKGKKGTTFNRVISKKRPVGVGVKNLLSVKSCYHLSCSGNDRANLLARKSEA